MIEAAAAGRPYEVWVPEETVVPLLYIKDAVRSLELLYEADASRIKTRNYNLGQIAPPPTARDLADIVKTHVPGAEITFKPDPRAVEVIQSIPARIDGSNARKEWDWTIRYGAEEMVRDFLDELKRGET
jgi:nucleoside-diphosphate-sugar epimerase